MTDYVCVEYPVVNKVIDKKWTKNFPPTKITTKNGDNMVDNVRESLGLTRDEQELLSLADEMASAMASLNAQTYDTFVLAREKFRLKIKRMVDKQQALDDRLAKIKAAVEAA